jgi:hypothetical protein
MSPARALPFPHSRYRRGRRGIDVGVQKPVFGFELQTAEHVFLSIDVSLLDVIGAADLEGGAKKVVGSEAEIDAGGDVAVSAVAELGLPAGDAAEDRDVQRFGCGWNLLSVGSGSGCRKEPGRKTYDEPATTQSRERGGCCLWQRCYPDTRLQLLLLSLLEVT